MLWEEGIAGLVGWDRHSEPSALVHGELIKVPAHSCTDLCAES